jgi:alkanesulfonate monooxygenase SsuD/methylene tetrahydromethanopterin reductase-like flavin-dependent oxidoreductase (luciferase family)
MSVPMTSHAEVRYGVHVPNMWEYGDPGVIAELAELAEECGWDGFFVWDHVLFDLSDPPDVCDPWVALAAAASRTRRIRLGPLVTPIPRRRPWKLAREVASLDVLSQGRMVFGAGLGAPPDAEFEAYGEDADPIVRRGKLDEGLELLRLLWSGERVRFAGEHYAVSDVTFRPTPVQSRVPIWVGGNWPNKRPFRRAARMDGVMPEHVRGDQVTPAELGEVVAFVAAERQRHAIDADLPYDVLAGGDTPARDPRAARAIVEPYVEAGATWWIERFHGDRGPLPVTRERLRAGPPRR